MSADFNPHPLWRGRLFKPAEFRSFLYFNPHPLWRGWLGWLCWTHACINFNPHPLWRGWQLIILTIGKITYDFNPHPLWRGRRSSESMNLQVLPISIHTLCEEGDIIDLLSGAFFGLFQSTPSVKRATTHPQASKRTHCYFNPHPLWRGRRLS